MKKNRFAAAMLVGLLVAFLLMSVWLPMTAHAAISGTPIDAINLSDDGKTTWTVTTDTAANTTTIVGTVTNDSRGFGSTDAKLTINGVSGYTMGTMDYSCTYTLKGGRGASKGSASITIGTTMYSIEGARNYYNSNTDTVNGKFDNWSETNSFSVTISAKGGTYALDSDQSTSSATVTIVLKFTAQQKDSVTFMPVSGMAYTVDYYQDATTPASPETIESSDTNGKILEGELSRTWKITPANDKYHCVGASYTNSNGTSDYYPITSDGFKPKAGDVITPLFVYDENGKAPFEVNGTGYWTWETAFAAAGNGSVVVLADDYTLPSTYAEQGMTDKGGTFVTGSDNALTYTIPAGRTLLVPFDDANTLYTTTPTNSTADDPWVQPTAYRTLTLGSNVSIVANGSISVSGKHSTAMSGPNGVGTNGAPKGPVGFISMGTGSSITVNSGGNLYAWGYIVGDGTVTIKSGATVYENLQITDWRGGTATASFVLDSNSFIGSIAGGLLDGVTPNKEKKVFPFSQYYVQNIEATLVMEAGATEYVYTTISAQSEAQGVPATLISSSAGLFRPKSGSTLTRTYDGKTDRVTYTIAGGMTMENLKISVKAVINVTINSAEYYMPLASNITVEVVPNEKNPGTVDIKNDLLLLPGARISIAEGTTANINANLIAFDRDEWMQANYSYRGKLARINYAYSKEYTRTEKDLIDAAIMVNGTLDASGGSLRTTNSGANIYSTSNSGKVIFATNSTETIYQAKQGTTLEFPSIPMSSSAVLKNADGTPLDPATEANNFYTYKNDHGKWVKGEHTPQEGLDVEFKPTCTDQGYTQHTCTCGSKYPDTYVDALGHSYGATTYTWSDDNTTCTAKHVCANDANHVETAAGNVTSEITTPATCTVKGTTTYTAAFDVTWAQTQTKEVQDVAALGHTQGAAVEENRVEATLYADGSYDYVVYCTVCNAEISRQTIVIPATAVAQVDKQKFASVADALEAAPVNGTITILSASADTPAFNKQVTVNKNGFTYDIQCAEGWTAEVNDSGLWVVKKVTEPGKFHIWASNVNMGNNLDMLFAIPKSALADWTGCYAKIERTFPDGSDPTKASELRIPLDQWQTLKQGGSEYYVITYGDFSAKEMCDTVTLTVYNSSDAPVSYPWTDSIRAYAMRIIQNQNPVNSAQVATAIDMLNFGAEAQKFFNYGVDKLANDLLTDTQKEGSTAQNINGSSSVEFSGYLTVTSHIQYAIGFTGQTKDMTATVTYTDHKGKDHKITGITSELLDEKYGFNIKDCLVVADARCPITITVYDVDNSVYTTCQDSIEAYIYRMIQNNENTTKKNVYAAFMKFADSAHAFLHLNDTPKEVAE